METCLWCNKELPPKPVSAKEHKFCPGSVCRSRWHAEQRKKALHEALALALQWQRDVPEDSPTRVRVGLLIERLRAAGAKESA